MSFLKNVSWLLGKIFRFSFSFPTAFVSTALAFAYYTRQSLEDIPDYLAEYPVSDYIKPAVFALAGGSLTLFFIYFYNGQVTKLYVDLLKEMRHGNTQKKIVFISANAAGMSSAIVAYYVGSRLFAGSVFAIIIGLFNGLNTAPSRIVTMGNTCSRIVAIPLGDAMQQIETTGYLINFEHSSLNQISIQIENKDVVTAYRNYVFRYYQILHDLLTKDVNNIHYMNNNIVIRKTLLYIGSGLFFTALIPYLGCATLTLSSFTSFAGKLLRLALASTYFITYGDILANSPTVIYQFYFHFLYKKMKSSNLNILYKLLFFIGTVIVIPGISYISVGTVAQLVREALFINENFYELMLHTRISIDSTFAHVLTYITEFETILIMWVPLLQLIMGESTFPNNIFNQEKALEFATHSNIGDIIYSNKERQQFKELKKSVNAYITRKIQSRGEEKQPLIVNANTSNLLI